MSILLSLRFFASNGSASRLCAISRSSISAQKKARKKALRDILRTLLYSAGELDLRPLRIKRRVATSFEAERKRE
jgi:hypothetical protein